MGTKASILDQDKYKKNFNTVVAFLTQYINKRAPTLSMVLPLSVRPDLLSSRGPVLVVALSEERSS